MSDGVRVGYFWKPLEPLTPRDRMLADSTLPDEVAAWRRASASLTRDQLGEVWKRVSRQWGIETGAIEGVYVIGMAATALMIDHGLNAAYMSHADNGRPPELVLQTVEDQMAGLDFVFDVVAQRRPLSSGFIKQLHHLMTQTQKYCTGIAPDGRRVEVPLHHGQFKMRPNNPLLDGGLIHQYCPPEQVTVEMEKLTALHAQYRSEGVPPDVHAAWLHHRYTQIHPFEDGNGRIARALASMVLIEAGWFPMTVTREDKPDYGKALVAADGGNLGPFVAEVGARQRKTLEFAHQSATALLEQNEPGFSPGL